MHAALAPSLSRAEAVGLGIGAPALDYGLAGLLAGLETALAGVAAFAAGITLWSNPAGGATEVTVPGERDVKYRFTQDTDNTLAITQTLPSGDEIVLFHGRPDADGVFRQADGSVVGVVGADGVVLNAAWIGGEKARRQARAQSRAVANDDIKLCPDRVPDRPGYKSLASTQYQTQITGLPPGLAVLFNGVVFDGCRTTDGVLLEAKGPRYKQFINRDGSDWQPWYEKPEETADQMQRQSMAAGNRLVEWHVAEKPAADFFARMAAGLGIHNIVVIYHPPVTSSPVKP